MTRLGTLAAALLAASSAHAADLGKAAPDFSLQDLTGKTFRLSDLRGKVVVLEWFNPECPFVRASHTVGSLVGAPGRYGGADLVWLAVNSAAAGKQGNDVRTNLDAVQRFKMGYPVLLDPTGETGKAYGATNTPHMFVIDREGKLVYRGAIDNSPDGERGAPQGGRLVEYVSAALDDLAAGRPVRTADTRAYGCSVKYAR
jgi:peroxiredoxin